MNETLILGGITVLLGIALTSLRVPASIAFLSLLIGQLLANEASADVYSFVTTLTNIPKQEYIQIVLLLLPLLLTTLILKGRVPKHKIIIEAVPLFLLSALAILLLAPFLAKVNILVNAASGRDIEAYKSMIVVAASGSALLSAWLSYPKPHGKGKKQSKHH